MPKSDWCRQHIDKINVECYGGDLSKDTLRDTKLANDFCKRAPFLSLQSTLTVNKIRSIKDPIIQGRVLEMVKSALESGKDPRTGERFKRKSGAMCITTPIVKWMISYSTSGVRPEYTKRNERVLPTQRVKWILNEITKLPPDRRVGGYYIKEDLMNRIKAVCMEI